MTPNIFTAELTVPAVSFTAHFELMSGHLPAVCIFIQLLRLRVTMFTVHLLFFFFFPLPRKKESLFVNSFILSLYIVVIHYPTEL